jgi:hypothetical protein
MLVIVAVLALLGILRFRKLSKRTNPGSAVAEDIRIVKEAGDER